MNLKKEFGSLSIIILAVLALYALTVNYPWKHFDEQIIYRETLFPAPLSFSQLWEFILNFNLKHYIEASNPFYTSIANLRSTPGGTFFVLLNLLLSQKNPFYYHLFAVILHIINSILCFLILNKTNSIIQASNNENKLKPNNNSLAIMFTLIWALNPLNIETVLLITNTGALVTYCFCMSFLFYLMTDWENPNIFKSATIAIIYLISLLLHEYSVIMPIIIFFYIYATSIFYKSQSGIKTAFFAGFKRLLPLTITLTMFSIYFISLTQIKIIQETDLYSILERIFWLSPQIFFHIVKLIIFPFHLTIDQSSLVKISDSLLSPYSVFCTIFMYGLILFSAIAAVQLHKKLFFYFFILFIPFFISSLPFLHIISPLYNLMSERYLYLPSFFFILGLSHLINPIYQTKSKIRMLSTSIFLFLILSAFSVKTYLRINDWKDSFSLFKSAINESRDNLIKGLRLQMLGALYSQEGSDQSRDIGNNLILEGNLFLEQSISENNLKEQTQKQYPKILTLYGLTPKSKSAKAAYLIALSKIGIESNLESAYQIMFPYMQNFSTPDTQILDFYLGILFATKRFDEAETLLNQAYKKRISPTIFIALAELQKIKYNDLTKAEAFLKESFQYFPYDGTTLSQLKNFYLYTSNSPQYAYFSYLYGLRTHSVKSLEEAFGVYQTLKDTKMEKIVLNNIEILKRKHFK